MMIPNDPVMLLSYVNTQLRDNYESLEEFCSSAGIEKDSLKNKLAQAGYQYVQELNQFK